MICSSSFISPCPDVGGSTSAMAPNPCRAGSWRPFDSQQFSQFSDQLSVQNFSDNFNSIKPDDQEVTFLGRTRNDGTQGEQRVAGLAHDASAAVGRMRVVYLHHGAGRMRVVYHGATPWRSGDTMAKPSMCSVAPSMYYMEGLSWRRQGRASSLGPSPERSLSPDAPFFRGSCDASVVAHCSRRRARSLQG